MIRHALLALLLLAQAALGQAVPTPTPKMPVGLNLTGVVYYGSVNPFRNVFKTSAWGPSVSASGLYSNIYPHSYPAVDSQGAAVPTPTFDADGYLTNGTGQGRYNDQTVFYTIPPLKAGTYKLRADGDGDWLLNANGKNAFYRGTFTGRTVATLDFPMGATGVQLELKRTNPANHVRNIQFMMPGYNFDDPLYFNDEFIASLQGFGVLRLMDFMETNADRVTDWSMRCPVTAQTFSDDNGLGGVPYETFSELASRTGADLWVNVPSRASDDYVAKLGAFLSAGLPAATNLYVELGNELWNGGTFPTAIAMQRAGIASGLYPEAMSPFEVQVRYAARRSYQVMAAMRLALGPAAPRFRPVLASQGPGELDWSLDEWRYRGVELGATTRPAFPLATPNPGPHAGAVSHYLGAEMSYPGQLEPIKAGGLDAMFSYLMGPSLKRSSAIGAACRAVADRHGVKLLAYEGGFENFAQVAFGDTAFQSLAVAASRDPRIGPAATAVLADAQGSFDAFMWFSHVSRANAWGQYGLVEAIDATPSAYPKYAAVHGWACAVPPAVAVVPTPPADPLAAVPPSIARVVVPGLDAPVLLVPPPSPR